MNRKGLKPDVIMRMHMVNARITELQSAVNNLCLISPAECSLFVQLFSAHDRPDSMRKNAHMNCSARSLCPQGCD